MLVEVTEGLMALGHREWQAAPQRSARSRLLIKHCFLVRTVMGVSLEAFQWVVSENIHVFGNFGLEFLH
jgi:hypothetical protein